MKGFLLRLFDRTNPVGIRVLTSRAHRLLSAGLCVVEYEGRRSGRTFRLPVGYHEIDDAVIVSTSIAPTRNWWRNFLEPHPARLCVRGEWREFDPEVGLTDEAIAFLRDNSAITRFVERAA